MLTKPYQTIILLSSLLILLVSMWQIEEIWRSLENGWPYNLPFGLSTANYWFAHDIWFILIFVSWIMLAYTEMKQNGVKR